MQPLFKSIFRINSIYNLTIYNKFMFKCFFKVFVKTNENIHEKILCLEKCSIFCYIMFHLNISQMLMRNVKNFEIKIWAVSGLSWNFTLPDVLFSGVHSLSFSFYYNCNIDLDIKKKWESIENISEQCDALLGEFIKQDIYIYIIVGNFHVQNSIIF